MATITASEIHVKRAVRWRPGGSHLVVVLFGLVLAIPVLSPLVALLYGAFMNAAPGEAGSLSLDAFTQAWSDPAAWTAAATSLGLAIARMIVVMPITIFLAWALTRTNIPLRGLLEGLVISHIFLPFLPLAMAWAVLASPRAGLLNVLLRNLLHLPITTGPINILSFGGLIWLSALGVPTFLYLLVGPAFRSMDASLEESARMSGLGPIATLRRITIPLLAPSIFGAGILAFILALQSFEPELILGQPANIYVFSTQIFHYIDGFSTPRYGPATALSTVFLLVTFILVLIQSRVLGSRQFTTVSGRGYRVQPMDLGRWRNPVFALVFAFVFFSTIVPLATLALASLMHIYGLFAPGWFTTQHYEQLLRNPKLVLAISNTLLVSVASAALALLVTLLTSYAVVRTRVAGRGLLDLITWVPLTVPGIVLAIGMTWAYLSFVRLPFPFYGTIGILVVAVGITLLPTGGRLMNGTMVQISSELEESARVHGASFTFMLRRILVPLLTPAMFSGFLVMFAFAMKNFVTVSLLYTPGSIVLSALQYEMWNGGDAEGAAALGTINMLFSMALILIYMRVIRRRQASAA
jgi:iron(III) transport system permease protein